MFEYLKYTLKVWLTTILCAPLVYCVTDAVIDGPDTYSLVVSADFISDYARECCINLLCTLFPAFLFWFFAAIVGQTVFHLAARMATILVAGLLATSALVLLFVYDGNEYINMAYVWKQLFTFCFCFGWSVLYFSKSIIKQANV